MTYVPVRTDSDAYSAVDGAADAFGVAVEASAGGFGIRRTVKGVETFEVLDAMPLNRAAVQEAVEAGSALTHGTTAAGFAAIDFASADLLTQAEVNAADGGIDSDAASAGDLT